MNFVIREVHTDDLVTLQLLVELAFEPIFASFSAVLGEKIFGLLYPDWRTEQRELVVKLYDDDHMNLWVAVADNRPVGLIVYSCNHETKHGEVDYLVVHPEYQRQGCATALNKFALAKLREAGMELVEVSTGGDEGHAPARRAYEKVGYTALPLVRYYQSLK